MKAGRVGLADGQEGVAARLQKGQRATFKGHVSGMILMSVMAKDCVLVPAAGPAARRALGLGAGPLLTSVTRGAIQGKDLAQLLELLLSHPDIDPTRAALPPSKDP